MFNAILTFFTLYYSIQELVLKKRQIEPTTYEINCESVKKPKQDVPIIITQTII